ncbi:MAG TPA: hypothetical protein VGO93_16015, partial [Candidatus Xenobia bacterium]
GDEATGTHVLHDLFAKMAEHPSHVDLSALWASLGIRMEHGKLETFDAPLSHVRDAITSR